MRSARRRVPVRPAGWPPGVPAPRLATPGDATTSLAESGRTPEVPTRQPRARYSPGGWECRGNRSGPQRWAGRQPGTAVASTPADLRGHTGARRRDGLPPTVLRHMLPVDHGRGPYRTASRIHRGMPKIVTEDGCARVNIETTTSGAAVAHDLALRVRGRSTHPFSALGPCWTAGDQRAGPTGHRRGVALPGHANHSSIHCGPCWQPRAPACSQRQRCSSR